MAVYSAMFAEEGICPVCGQPYDGGLMAVSCPGHEEGQVDVCPDCGEMDGLRRQAVNDSDVVAVWCEYCDWEDAV